MWAIPDLALPGKRPTAKPLLVGAHYDGPPPSIGADENASRVIALLEMGHRWSIDPPKRPVWIVALIKNNGAW